MFAATRATSFAAKRAFSTSAANLSKVTVLGAMLGLERLQSEKNN